MIEFRDSLFRALMLASEAGRCGKTGSNVGDDRSDADTSFINEVLELFGHSTRNEALLMSRLYAVIYCFEHSVRELISNRLNGKHGPDWWDTRVPRAIRESALRRQQTAERDHDRTGRKGDAIAFIDCGDLRTIVMANWNDFSEVLPSKHWLMHHMDQLEKSRDCLARNRPVTLAELQQVSTCIAGWNRTVGLQESQRCSQTSFVPQCFDRV